MSTLSDLVQDLRQSILKDEADLLNRKAALRLLENADSTPVKHRGRQATISSVAISAVKSVKRPGWSPERRARTLASMRARKNAKLAPKPSLAVPDKPKEIPKQPQAKKALIKAIKSVKPAIPAKADKKTHKKTVKRAVKKTPAKISAMIIPANPEPPLES